MAADDDPVITIDGLQALTNNRENWEFPLGNNWRFVERIYTGHSAMLVHYHCEDDDAPHTKDVVLKINYRRRRANRPHGYPPHYAGFVFESQFLNALSGLYPRGDEVRSRRKGDEDYDAEDEKRGIEEPDVDIPRRPQCIVREYCHQTVNPVPLTKAGPNEISFLEYCPGVTWEGEQYFDLEVFNRKNVPQLSEVDIWTIFKQFTRMILMMDSGNELVILDEERNTRRHPDWDDYEMCHYDIEPRNILIGYRKSADDRVPMLKLCDFGDALQVPKFRDQVSYGRYKFPNQPDNGREGFRTPEAVIGDTEFVRPLRHGSCSNIFQFAQIIRCLMHQDQSADMHVHPEDEDWIEGLPKQYQFVQPQQYQVRVVQDKSSKLVRELLPLSYGPIDEAKGEIYSGELRALVTECMRESASERPHARDLWMRVRDGYLQSIMGRKGAYDEKRALRTFPPIHPIFAATAIAPPHFRTGDPEWLTDAFKQDPATTPLCLSPPHTFPILVDISGNPILDENKNIQRGPQILIDDDFNYGDDLKEDLHDMRSTIRSRPQVPRRFPHGFPVTDTRPSVNIPERRPDIPGSIGRNVALMEYYDRLGHMWMGEERYWKMLEAGLHPDTYNYEMKFPDPERDFDQEPLEGVEYTAGDSEEDWDKPREGDSHK